MTDKTTPNNLASYCWSIADLLRGDFRQSQYGRIILPFTLLRRLEGVLEASKEQVLAEYERIKPMNLPEEAQEKLLLRATQINGDMLSFYNVSKMDLSKLGRDDIKANLESYIQGFSKDAREIFEYFNFAEFLGQLNDADLLFKVVQKVRQTDLSPKAVTNHDMGLVFEELIRKFAESSNDTAGEHFTPRDIVHLTTSLALTGQEHRLTPHSIITIYDPTVGTGGFLTEGEEYIKQVSENVSVNLFGQELNGESYAICKAEMLIKGKTANNIKLGDTLAHDQLAGERFNIMLSNPPFGVNWNSSKKAVEEEHRLKGFDGRFGPGLPRVSDGSLLFLLHLVSKMHDASQEGSRIGIILNGSPLFTGGAGSGESEIRRYLLQNDLVEAIIALPTDMFYNTGIATYVWILSNQKAADREGKVQLIDASADFAKMRKSLGSKRHYITEEQIDQIVRLYGRFEETPTSKIFANDAFGYRRITVERPLRLNFQASPERIEKVREERMIDKLDEDAREHLIEALQSIDSGELFMSRPRFLKALKKTMEAHEIKLRAPERNAILKALSEQDPDADLCKKKGKPEADTSLRDYENVPLGESIYEYFEREVRPHVPDAWIDEDKRDELDGEVGIVGFEIPFNRHFYVFEPPRPLEEIDRDLKACTDRIKRMIEEISQ